MPNIIQLQNPYLPGQSPYEIFTDRMGAVAGIANGIKRIRENKWESDLIKSISSDIMNYDSDDEVERDTTLLNQEYVEPQEAEINEFAQNVIDIVGRTDVGMMTQHEQMMGVKEPQTSMISQEGEKQQPTEITKSGDIEAAQEIYPYGRFSEVTKTKIPKEQPSGMVSGDVTEQGSNPVALPQGSIEQILGMVQRMDGAIDFSKTLKMIEQRKASMPVSPLEQNVVQHVMNQPSPREQMASDLELAQSIQSALYPEKAAEERIATEQALADIDVQAYQQKRELDKIYAEADESKRYKTVGGHIFDTHTQQYISPSKNQPIPEYIQYKVYDEQGKLKIVAVDKNTLEAKEIPLSDEYYGGTQGKPTSAGGETTDIETEETAPYSSGKPLANATQSIREELSNIKSLEGLENFARQYGEMGYNTSNLLTPEFQTDFFVNKANRYREALETLVQTRKTNTDDFRRILKGYNAFRDTVNNLGIKEIPEFEYEKGTVEKIKDKIGTDDSFFAQELLKRFDNLEEAMTWVNENKGTEIETDDGKKLKIDWDNLIRLLEQYSDPSKMFEGKLKGL